MEALSRIRQITGFLYSNYPEHPVTSPYKASLIAMADSTATESTGQYLQQAKELKLETRKVDPLASDEVQIAVRSVTLCGSDLHYFSHFRNGDIFVKEPLCLGHEAAGEITAVGNQVKNIGVGDLVAIEAGVPCEDCDFCHIGRYNICPQLRFRSSGSKFPHYQGMLQKTVNHPSKWVHKLPPTLGSEIGALLEPLSVAIQAVRRIEGTSSTLDKSSCLIFGAGAIGLLVSVAAQAAGWQSVVIADIDDARLSFAKANGFATKTYQVPLKRGADISEKLHIAKETAQEIENIAGGKLAVVFECTGVESCLQASIYAAKSGGSVALIGLGVPNHTLPISEATAREINMIPCWRYANTYPKAIEIAETSVTGNKLEGRSIPDLRLLITHRFDGLGEVERAFDLAGRPKDAEGATVIKTVVNL